MKKIIYLFLLMALFNGAAHGSKDKLQTLFEEGNQAYKSGNYSEAIKSYTTIVNDYESSSPQVFYNLGNAYFKANKIGQAILYYEKARRLLPRDSDITFNLEHAQKEAQTRLGTPPGDNYWFSNLWTLNELSMLTSFSYFAFSLFLFLYVVKKKEKFLWILCLTGFIMITAFILLGAGIYQAEATKYGIVTAPSAEMRTGPDLSASVSCIIPEGSKVTMTGREEEWVEVKITGLKGDSSSGVIRGWIPDKDVKNI